MTFIRSRKHYAVFMMWSLIIYTLINNHIQIKEEILQAAAMWCTVLLPALFPYLVISQYIGSSDTLNCISLVTEPFFKRLLHTSRSGISVFLCSLFCGYPSGAVCTNEMYKNSLITREEAQRIICFTNNAGPLFLISAVGTGMLGNTADGIALYVIQVLSAVCYAFISGVRQTSVIAHHSQTAAHRDKDFCECVKTAVNTIINIGGYIIITSVLCRIIIILLLNICPHMNVEARFQLETIIYAVFEISRASGMLANISASHHSYALLCAAVSWSGIAVFLQVKSSLSPDIKIRRFICAKFIQAIISAGFGYIYKSLFPAIHFHINYNFIFASFVVCILIFITFIILSTKKSKA